MADLTQTIRETLSVLGPAKPTRWGTTSGVTMIWGTSLWGDYRMITELVAVVSVAESMALADTISTVRHSFKTVTDELAVASDLSSESLRTSNGYYYVFTRPTTDAESRNLSTYTVPTAASTSYSTATAATTTWSEA